MRVRVRYRKQGRLRFVSAIDVGRLWERALRRADLPIAYSEGFTPHPKVSFTDALPLGCASDGEYAELTFAAPVAIEDTVARLNAAFPDGMSVTAAVPVEDGTARFSKLLPASVWDVDYAHEAHLAQAAAALAADDTAIVGRERKGEILDVDIRPALHELSTAGHRLRVVIHHADHLPEPVAVAIRPSEVDAALRTREPQLPPPALVTRLAQGRPGPDGLVEALTGELIEPLGPVLQRHAT